MLHPSATLWERSPTSLAYRLLFRLTLQRGTKEYWGLSAHIPIHQAIDETSIRSEIAGVIKLNNKRLVNPRRGGGNGARGSKALCVDMISMRFSSQW